MERHKTHGFWFKSPSLMIMPLSQETKADQAPPLKAGNRFFLFFRRWVVRLLAAILESSGQGEVTIPPFYS